MPAAQSKNLECSAGKSSTFFVGFWGPNSDSVFVVWATSKVLYASLSCSKSSLSSLALTVNVDAPCVLLTRQHGPQDKRDRNFQTFAPQAKQELWGPSHTVPVLMQFSAPILRAVFWFKFFNTRCRRLLLLLLKNIQYITAHSKSSVRAKRIRYSYFPYVIPVVIPIVDPFRTNFPHTGIGNLWKY